MFTRGKGQGKLTGRALDCTAFNQSTEYQRSINPLTHYCLFHLFQVILKQLVDAAKDLEEKHIFHRDIKSENILIETSSDVPRVRIIDFGLSCFAMERSRFRFFYGTAIHTPPECYRGKKYRPGPTTVWQMGVVLYEALHVGDFNTETFLQKELEFNKHLSSHCRNFLDACLTNVPKKRPTLGDLQLHPWLR
uniref:non-specific serine/threonine protein kinase n=1 Tax=Oreochromis niloticus TaxID=8128 RepID=A0A669BD95_ORENI